MRKILSFVLILFLAVISSACVNSYAVHELNEIAGKFLEDGDLDSAIARLESSVDLDPNIYESRFNLANAYLRKGMCEDALEQMTVAKEINPNEAGVYYSLGVANECLANELYEKKDEHGNIIKIEMQTTVQDIDTAKKYVAYLKEAVENYDQYVEIEPNAYDSKTVIKKSLGLKQIIEDKSAKYKIKD